MEYVLDVHTHTLASGHAYSTMREMAQAAADKGLELLGITEHAMSMPWTCGDFYFQNLRMVEREMCGIELLLGSEVNIMDFDGTVDMPAKMMEGLDIIIASMHPPCVKSGTKEENTRAYLRAMQNPLVDIIGHPDDGRFPVDFKELVEGAKEYDCVLELNNNSLDSRCTRTGGWDNYREMLTYCKAYQVPVICNSDAHTEQLVGHHTEGYQLLEEIGFPEELVMNCSVAALKKHLRKFR